MTILVPSVVRTTEWQVVWTEVDAPDEAPDEAVEWLNDDGTYLHSALESARTIGYWCVAETPDEGDWTHIYDACHGPWRPGEPEYYGWALGPDGRWRDQRWDVQNAA